MGGGGGSKSTSTSKSYSGSGQLWAQPLAKDSANDVRSVFNQNQPALQGLSNYAQGDFLSGLKSQLGQSQGVAGQGNQYYSDVLSGKYMNATPYLQSVIDSASGDIMGNVNAMFSHNGRYGSEAHQGEAMRQLANMENQFRYGDYNTQMGRMDAAAAAGQAGANADAAQVLGGLTAGAELPYTGINNLSQDLGALFSGGMNKSKQKSTTSGPGIMGGLLGAAGSIGSALITKSERRVKKNIVEVGELEDGLKVYDFEYRDGHGPVGVHRGVMVDEVAVKRPHALGPIVDGVRTVNYGAL